MSRVLQNVKILGNKGIMALHPYLHWRTMKLFSKTTHNMLQSKIRFPLFYYFGKIAKSRYLSNKALHDLPLPTKISKPTPAPSKVPFWGVSRSRNQFYRIRRKGNIRVDVGLGLL